MGEEEIEWKDRAWGLLENKGQVQVDTWSVVGMVGGRVAVMRMRRRCRPVGRVRPVVGSAGLGGTVGIVGYLVWRLGIQGGRSGRIDSE